MRRVLALAVLLTAPALSQSPPVIHSLSIAGGESFSRRELLDVLQLRQGDRWSAAAFSIDSLRLREYFLSRGYPFAGLKADLAPLQTDSTALDVTIRIGEGPLVRVDSIGLAGNRAFSAADLRRNFLTSPGEAFVAGLLKRDADNLVTFYENSGYPFASVSVQDVRFDSGASGVMAVPVLAIDEGKRVTIDDIRVAGNANTNADVIVRETRLRLHDLYRRDQVARIPAALRRMGFFTSVKEPDVFIEGNEGGLLITVSEANPNIFDGILGYVPDPSGSGGIVTGLVRVVLGNMFGTARRLNVEWQRDDRSSQDIDIGYREPWVFGLPVACSGMFHERQQDSLYIQRTVEGHADVSAAEAITLGVFATHTAVIPSSTLAFQPLRASRTITAGLSGQYDSRDEPVSPTAGILYQTTYRLGSKKIFGGSSDPLVGSSFVHSVTMDFEAYRELFQRQVVALGLHGRQTEGSRLEIADYFRFGGATTLRGYREKEFIGTRVAWANTEYRYLFEQHSFVFGFFDVGFSYLPGDTLKGATKLLKVGYGIGTRFDSPVGNLGISLAFGEGDSFSQAKLHVALMGRF